MTREQDPITLAARLLRATADELQQSCTPSSDRDFWAGEEEAKAAYDEHMAAADALERWAESIGAGGVEPLRRVLGSHSARECSGMTTPQTDRELLELAAKAAGFDTSHKWNRASMDMEPPVVAMVVRDAAGGLVITGWDPLDNSGDALNLAVKLKIRIGFRPCAYADTPTGLRFFGARDGNDQFSRTRLAIVRAAAEIGRAMP